MYVHPLKYNAHRQMVFTVQSTASQLHLYSSHVLLTLVWYIQYILPLLENNSFPNIYSFINNVYVSMYCVNESNVVS